MAGQRWGQRGRHGRGRNRRGVGLALVAALALMVGCGGEPRDPTGLDDSGPAGGGGGGGSGGGAGPEVLVGEWRNVLLIRLDSDVQRITTTWRFEADLDCRRTVATFSVLEDRELTTMRDCTYRASGASIDVLYHDATEPVTFSYTLANFSVDRLVLGGFEFTRIP